MEMTRALPSFTVLKPDGDGWMKYASDDTIVNNVGGEGVFDLFSKIEIEPAKTGSGYFHLRFYQNNKYLARGADKWLVANSTTPEEDTSKPSCTLFSQPEQTGPLQHVQSLGYVNKMEDSTGRFYVDPTDSLRFTFLDWETFVKLPKFIAFRGDNGCYLQGVTALNNDNFLQFVESDMNQEKCGYEIFNLPDGHIAVKSDLFGKFWRNAYDSWILPDSTSYGSYDNNTLFWPVKIDENTIALRNEGNKNFCKRYTANGFLEDLNAGTPTITNDAIIGVVERVRTRTVYNVVYRMDEARIHNLQPFVAGTTTATNKTDVEGAVVSVSLNYEDSSSHSFSHSISVTAGVKVTFKADVLFIVEGGLEVSFSVNYTYQWGDTTTTTKSVTATGTVPVPAKSKATVSYVGTVGTCDVPFTYTQEDVNAIDGTIIRTEEIDGIFRGVNSYNFDFVFDKVEPL